MLENQSSAKVQRGKRCCSSTCDMAYTIVIEYYSRVGVKSTVESSIQASTFSHL